MNTAPTRYLAAIDGQKDSAHVAEIAADLASLLGGRAELHLVHVIFPSVPQVPIGLVSTEAFIEEGRTILDGAIAAASAHFGGAIVGHLRSGQAAAEVIQLAADIAADLVVVGTSDKGAVDRVLVGSVASKVVREARCPVLVTRPKTYPAAVAIEPPCPACLEVQAKTKRVQLWCERHRAHHPHGRIHEELPASFALGSMLIRP